MRDGRSLVPGDLALNEAEAEMGLAFFDALPLPDGLDEMTLGQAAGQWFRDLVRVMFGAWDPAVRRRAIRDFFVMAPKGSSKTTYSAGLMLTAMMMNKRHNVEALFVGPTQTISDRAYDQATAMISKSQDLQRRFHRKDHEKTIQCLVTDSELKVKTFALDILTGAILIFALVDELHLLGRSQHTTKVLRQIRGGLDKTNEGALLITTTQSDEIPAGAFRDELYMARKIRDGQYRGKIIRPMLPLLYEFPTAIAKDKDRWGDPANWPMVMPNLNRSIHLHDLVPDWNSEREKGDKPTRIWASQHLNIEMGVGMKTDGWPGAAYWAHSEDETITLQSLLQRSEAVVVGIDGGGLDDLYGLSVLGREPAEIAVTVKIADQDVVIKMKRWLCWSHAWCHRGVLERRQSIATRLLDFEAAGELTIVDDTIVSLAESIGIIRQVNDAGLLACVAIDAEGPYGELVDALAELEITQEGGQVEGVGQGYKLMNAIKTSEGRLSNRMLTHARSSMMDWSVENVKIEPTATAIRATKQNAGDAKIDSVMALFDAVSVMVKNPEAVGGRSFWDDGEFDEEETAEDDESEAA
ncbi:terminase large subunit [Mesorhizobium sp. M0578]|uniref:terminase large subunit domain-containing protein n=1 Tax=unclassified Mesorhizobium TaxID=325217 RepID=UPI003335289C